MSDDSIDSIVDLLPFVSWYDQTENEYRDQIGAALLAFNRIENDVSELIASVLYQRDRPDLIGPTLNKQLAARVDALELLLTSEPKFPRMPVERIKELAGKRNGFAHGHFTFDQNTGDPIIKGKGKVVPWDDQSIEPFVIEARQLHDELTTLSAWVAFGPEPAPCRPGRLVSHGSNHSRGDILGELINEPRPARFQVLDDEIGSDLIGIHQAALCGSAAWSPLPARYRAIKLRVLR